MEGNFRVTNLIDHDNLESRTPGSQDDNPKVTLPMVDVVHQLPPVTAPVERKTGGHHDRQTWANQFMPAVGHGTFKVLTLLAEYANPKGQCWPSMELLRHRSGMSDRALRRAFSDLRGKGIVGAGQPGLAVWLTNPYQLSGGLNGWTCAESGIGPVPKVAQVPVPKVAHITRDSSSNPIINPGYPGVVDAKREPDEVTDGGFKSSSFEEEGVTGDRVTGDRVTGDRVTGDRVTGDRVTEGRVTEGRVTEGRVTEGRVTEGQLTVEDIQEWVDGHLSETPLPFEIQQVGKHCWPAWSKHWDLDLAGAIVVWTKTEASRRKFRKDVVMHLGKVGLPKPKQADPED